MRRRGRVLILLGLILAILAFILAYYLLQGGAAPPPEVETAQVVVALAPIAERTEIPVEAVGTKELPVNAIPANALRDPSEVLGKFSLVQIFPDQIILSDMVVDKSEVQKTGQYASFAIPQGFVAIAVPITDTNSVARAIQAGDFVDVLVTIRYKVVAERISPEGAVTETELGESLVVQLTLQDVEVLKVGLWGTARAAQQEEQQQQQGEQQQERAQGPAFLTLLVRQQDALVLKYARDDPSFVVDFALRGVGDHSIVTTDSVTLDYLLTRFNITPPTALPRIIAPP
ncbi:MAG: Flp pilus assembly protein CpaB [Chloroflexi bacterium]|nr:Flp pilus assembly protein CpaB [Chloroflexota bacterium]